MFTGPFPSRNGQVYAGAKIRCEVDGILFLATIHRDDDAGTPEDNDDGFWPSLDRSAPGWIGDNPAKSFDQQMKECQAVMARHKAGKMIYCGVAVTAEKAGFRLTGEYDNAIWCIDINWPHSDNTYLVTIANEILSEAIKSAKASILTKIESARLALATLEA